MFEALGPKAILIGLASILLLASAGLWRVAKVQEEPSFDVPLVSPLAKKTLASLVALGAILLLATVALYPKF